MGVTTFFCPHCARALLVTDWLHEASYRCPACQHTCKFEPHNVMSPHITEKSYPALPCQVVPASQMRAELVVGGIGIWLVGSFLLAESPGDWVKYGFGIMVFIYLTKYFKILR